MTVHELRIKTPLLRVQTCMKFSLLNLEKGRLYMNVELRSPCQQQYQSSTASVAIINITQVPCLLPSTVSVQYRVCCHQQNQSSTVSVAINIISPAPCLLSGALSVQHRVYCHKIIYILAQNLSSSWRCGRIFFSRVDFVC